MTTTHTDCAHEATKSARATCRKARAAKDLALNLAVDALFDAAAKDAFDWISYGAIRMAHAQTPLSQYDAAVAVIRHFAPSGDEAKDDRRRRNGWTITTDARTIRSIILRAAS